MSCSVGVPNSPVFSSPFYNKNSIIPSSPESLTLPIPFLKPTDLTTSSCSSPSPSSSSSFTSTVLKRQRPAKLHIPIASPTFGISQASMPKSTARNVEEVEGNGFFVARKRGEREHMEDRYSATINLDGESKQAFFGIFDGHGGTKASEFAANNLEKNVLDEVIKRDECNMKEAVRCGYLNTDSDFLKEDLHGGSCCVTALIRNGNLVVSNVGDCRAVISREGVAEALTSDHKPSREDERERIETQVGYVDICHGVWRIQGSLAISRGIGDIHLKQWVIAESETKVLKIEPQHDLLILASDGLWEKVSNQEAVDIARPFCTESNRPQPLMALKLSF